MTILNPAPLTGKTVLVVNNGTLSLRQLVTRFNELGANTRTVDVGNVAPDLSGFDALVLSGTKVRAYDTEHYRHLLHVVDNTDKPVLGVCGGMQLMLTARGAQLEPGEQRVGGHWATVNKDERIFDYVDTAVRVFHRHTLYVKTVPPGFTSIGRSELAPVEFVRSDDHRIFGSQAHLEFGPDGKQILRGFADRITEGPSRAFDTARKEQNCA
ncbi:gamma-glutamyl-gamma-aminobutyrate hydrolase family protein [Brevibacterium sp. XM4083]|uniref:type 1 glutamine amidotransferase n=1 Tax=Brevibacterium sp. XM4083 TaxID=2583238 RepID=UPI00112CE0E6|nr:gamma-glutamyl-gamma-aminobutyrate hydrolase family protein [Brevibacterium sp. XM4083]MCM1011815.1 gamma-glutamyl-gamma-aminobutyrate hydrolase family protein [Brevibacterium sp. XM4083]